MVRGEYLRHGGGRYQPPVASTVHKEHDTPRRSTRHPPGLISDLLVHYGHFSPHASIGCMPCMGHWELPLCDQAAYATPVTPVFKTGQAQTLCLEGPEGDRSERITYAPTRVSQGALPMPQLPLPVLSHKSNLPPFL